MEITGLLFWQSFFYIWIPTMGSLNANRKEVKMTKQTKLQERKMLKEYLNIEDNRVLDTKKAGIELIADDEIFVLVNHTYNYWVSNYGRMVNNLRGNFYLHRTDKKRSDNGSTHFTVTAYTDEEDKKMYKIDTYLDRLVAETFLECQKYYDKLWHVDGDRRNCFYRNLMWVNKSEYSRLERGVLTVEDLGRQQEYVPYVSMKGNVAYSIWNGIYSRCYQNTGGACYDKAFMCEQWRNTKDGKDRFAEWYSANYYECDGENMAVDKDLIFPGNKEYAPNKCCILPQTLNTMLSNCKKHGLPNWKTSKLNLPLGVRYNEGMGKYYGEIKPWGHDEVVRLSFWDTPEEAFEEYKKFKQADILIIVAKYKNKIPKKVYDALLKVDVKPY